MRLKAWKLQNIFLEEIVLSCIKQESALIVSTLTVVLTVINPFIKCVILCVISLKGVITLVVCYIMYMMCYIMFVVYYKMSMICYTCYVNSVKIVYLSIL